jgi:hypothetical protein
MIPRKDTSCITYEENMGSTGRSVRCTTRRNKEYLEARELTGLVSSLKDEALEQKG